MIVSDSPGNSFLGEYTEGVIFCNFKATINTLFIVVVFE